MGEDAEENPEAVVTLILDGVDINCSVAPAVIFYNVYECGDKDNAIKEVDTIKAGANVVMPNLSPLRVRKLYMLYENKISTGDEAAQSLASLKNTMSAIGYDIVTDIGNVKR